MTRSLRFVLVMTAALAVADCDRRALPTAPSPTATRTTAPSPEVSSLSGTWLLGGIAFMTLDQDGNTIVGIQATAVRNGGNGVLITTSGLVSGTVDGNTITLYLSDTVIVAGLHSVSSCTSDDVFVGEISGNSISGTLRAGTTGLTCGGDTVSVPIPPPHTTGPASFTKL